MAKIAEVKTKESAMVISQADLRSRLLQVRGTTFIHLESTTEPKMNKTGNPLHDLVVKDSITNCIVGFSYENMVDNARGRELSAEVIEACEEAGVSAEILAQFKAEVKTMASESAEKFTASSRKWGTHVRDPYSGEVSRILIEHINKDKQHNYYLQVAILGTQPAVYRYKESGEVLTADDLAIAKSFMPKRKEGARQGLKNPIIVRDYNLGNVKRIHLNKARYKVQ